MKGQGFLRGSGTILYDTIRVEICGNPQKE